MARILHGKKVQFRLLEWARTSFPEFSFKKAPAPQFSTTFFRKSACRCKFNSANFEYIECVIMDGIKAKSVEQVSCEPMVGIFWLYNSGLIAHGTSLPEAEKYGDCLTSPTSHIDYWTELQHYGNVSRDVEYEEPPRGRVVFDVRKQQFFVYAGRCILTRLDVVRQIVAQMALPSDVTTATDAHYRCYRCIYHSRTSMEQDE